MKSPRGQQDFGELPNEGAYQAVAPSPQGFQWPADAVPPQQAYQIPNDQSLFNPLYGGSVAQTGDDDEEEAADDIGDMASAPPLQALQGNYGQPVFYPYIQTLAQQERGWADNIEEGYAYVKVLEARCRKEGNYLVNMTLRNASKKTKTESSKVVKKTAAPPFHTEFVFAIPPMTGPSSGVLLEVAEKKLIGSKTVGGVTLGTAQIMGQPPHRQTVDLGSAGSVDVVTAFAPVRLHPKHWDQGGKGAPFVKQLPSVRVALERRVYFAGEQVKGVAFVNVRGTPKEVYSLEVKVKGIVRYHSYEWVVEHYTDSNGHRQTRRRKQHHYETHKICRSSYFALGSKETKKAKQATVMPPGATTFPFDFWLDPLTPPSAYFDTGDVGVLTWYYVSCHVATVKKTERNKKVKVPLQVLTRYVPPVAQVLTKSMSFAFNREVPVVLRAKMPEQQLFPGCPASISIEVDNTSKKNITRVDISLTAYVWARAHGHTHGGRLFGLKLNAKTLDKEFGFTMPIKSGESRNAEITFTTPGRLGPTIVMPGGACHWQVFVSVRYGLKSCTIAVPVLMQPATPYYLRDFPCTPVWSTVHKSQVFMHAENRDVEIPWWAMLAD